MEYVCVADTSDLVLGQMKKVRADGRDILIANVASTFYAIGDTCPHRGGSLCAGKLADFIVECPRHGAKFDIRTGKSFSGAHVFFFGVAVRDVDSYPVLVDGNKLFVGLPERCAAPVSTDPQSIRTPKGKL